jgi:hypothetical protein
MAVIGGETFPTMLDITKRLDPNGAPAKIAELLQQTNEILIEAPWYEGNLPIGNQMTQRTGLPSVYYRRMNQGVPPSKSTTAQITVLTSMLEAWSQIDERQVALNGASWMMSEEAAFMQAMNQQLAQTVFYGATSTTPEQFTGLSVQYSSKSAINGKNIIDAGGVGTDNTTIWLATWGPRIGYMTYPQGGSGALQHEDLGRLRVTDAAGNPFMAFSSHWKMTPGFCLEDWRGFVRIGNIDVSNLVGETSAADILKLMTKAVHKVPPELTGKQAFYMNGDVLTMLDIQAQNKANVYLTIGEEEGRPKVSFRGIPLRRCDRILSTEATIV